MKRKSIICTILALSLILVGTGYAYWTDSLNVTTRATTGDLDVTFADLGLYAQYGNEYQGGNWSIIDGIGATGYIPASYFERGASDYNSIAAPGSVAAYYEYAKGYNSVTFDAKLVDAAPIPLTVGPYTTANTNGSDLIEITVENMYPGYAQAFRTDILNLGSIAAKLGQLNFSTEYPVEGGNLESMLGIALLIEREYSAQDDLAEAVNVFELCKVLNLPDEAYFTVGGVEFVRLQYLHDISKEVMAQYGTLLALPSENRMDLYIGIAMDPDAEGVYTSGTASNVSDVSDALSQNKAATVSITLLWDQFNEGVNADSVNRLVEQNRQ